jgi:hypothetical protein
MSTKRSVGRITATSKKDRSGLCAITFADGRHCRTPRRSGHLHLCYFHAEKEAKRLAAKQAGEAISSFFFSDYLSACDLSAALGRVFSAVAEGHLKPKVATALAYLGQTLNQSVMLARNEYASVFGGDVWRRRVAACLEPPPRPPQPVSRPAPTPQPKPASTSLPTSQQAPSPSPHPDSNSSNSESPASPPASKPSTSDPSQ